MAYSASMAEVHDVRRKAMSLAARARTSLAKADKAIDVSVTAVVTGGTAFAFGVAQGRYGGLEVAGVPADLGAALVLHGLGFAGVGGKQNDYLHAAANGALACYLSTLGRGVGVDWRARSLTGGSSGSLPAGGAVASGATISDEELARMARGGA